MVLSRLQICLLGVAVLSNVASADAADFATDVRPILQANCVHCHDSDTLAGGVGLDRFYHAQRPTDAGEKLFVPGQPDESVLLRVLTAEDPKHRMPLDEEPLKPTEIDTVRAWITAGADWPDDGWRPPVHWSYKQPVRPELPDVDSAWLAERNGNEIDRFIVFRLHAAGLEMNPPAEPARLLRRIYLDLTGLPPTAAQVDDFLTDPSFERYVDTVDRLLESPRFGEAWAIGWLDLARYADSEGYQRDAPRTMWPWRDWVIDAVNSDMPFDQFSIEQLAGDLLPEATQSQLIATAFHRNAATNLEAGTDPVEDRYKTIVDRVNTTGSIWLGLTVGCAQCHNHKYDPISAKEYYELFAFFNNTPMETRQQGDKMGMSGLEHIGPSLKVPLTPLDQAKLEEETAGFETVRAELEEQIRDAAQQAIASRQGKQADPPKAVQELLDRTEPLTLKQCRELASKAAVKQRAGFFDRITRATIQQERIARLRDKQLRIMRDREQVEPTFIAMRGDFASRGAQVQPGTPAALHQFSSELPANRLGLARWLVSEENPLVGRAFVNRVWIELFGRGLVSTPEDFGPQGALPSHPELLDWLAVTFVDDDGWSRKQLIRRIVLSATYRQSVAVRAECHERDPLNELFWRHPGHRFKAEIIRDQALAISGMLTETIGGVTVRPYQPETFWRKTAGAGETYYLPSAGADAYRRGIYTLWRRNAHYPSFANFDAPDRSSCTLQRNVSNTPLQALTLLNDPVFVELAEAFAERIVRDGGADLDKQLQWAFRSVLARHPTAQEKQLLRTAYHTVKDAEGEQAAYRQIATILLNLHETINRS